MRRPRKPRQGRRGLRNPWREEYVGKDVGSPCRRCGGSGRLIEYSHINQGVCYRCGGDGLDPLDWRGKPPVEKFELLGKPVRVYQVKGKLHYLIREEDYAEHGAPILGIPSGRSGRPQKYGSHEYFGTPFFLDDAGNVTGAYLLSVPTGERDRKGDPIHEGQWRHAEFVGAPWKPLADHYGQRKWYSTLWPEPDEPQNPQLREKIWQQHRRMSERLTHALNEHYRAKGRKNPQDEDPSIAELVGEGFHKMIPRKAPRVVQRAAQVLVDAALEGSLDPESWVYISDFQNFPGKTRYEWRLGSNFEDGRGTVVYFPDTGSWAFRKPWAEKDEALTHEEALSRLRWFWG